MTQAGGTESMGAGTRKSQPEPARGSTQATRRLDDYGDDALMLRAQRGDKEAFEVLVGRHAEMVLAVSSKCLADSNAGREAAEEVFLRLWSERHRCVSPRPLKGFLAYLTREAVRSRATSAAAACAPSASAEAQGTPSLRSGAPLRVALGGLSAEDREVLVTRYGMDLGYDEIAEATGHPAGTVRSRAFGALRAMRSMMNDATRPSAVGREEA